MFFFQIHTKHWNLNNEANNNDNGIMMIAMVIIILMAMKVKMILTAEQAEELKFL